MMTIEEQRYEDLRAGHHIAHIREWERHEYSQMLARRRAEAARLLSRDGGRSWSTRRAR